MQIIGYIAVEGIVASPLHISGAIKPAFVVDALFATSASGAGDPAVRSVRTFGAMPSEEELRYPATLVNGAWVAGTIDPTDPKLLSSFRLDYASGLEDGGYRNLNVNSTGAFIPPVRTTD